MNRTAFFLVGFIASFTLGFYVNTLIQPTPLKSNGSSHQTKKIDTIEKDTPSLGAFSVSLSVNDLKKSKRFYQDLGFSPMGGSIEQNYLIMKNGNALIGIFQDMFEGNILTFNPGWDHNAVNIDPFDDIREIQRRLKSKNIQLDTDVDEKSKGPASIMFTDPDGNMILVDQHR